MPPGRAARIAGFALLALLPACAVEPPEASRPLAPAGTPGALAERLPARAAGFQRGAAAPVDRPAAGIEVSYATEGRHAAGFVQVLHAPEGPPLADGPADPRVAGELARWSAEAARGPVQSRRLSVTGEFMEPEEAPLFRCAALAGRYGRQPVRSQVCVGAAGGQMLRLRVSMPEHDPPLADARAFARAVALALRGLPPEPEPVLPTPVSLPGTALPPPEGVAPPRPAATRRPAPVRPSPGQANPRPAPRISPGR